MTVPKNLYDWMKWSPMTDKPIPPGNNSNDDEDMEEITAAFDPQDVMAIGINVAQFFLATLEVLGPGFEFAAAKLTEGWTQAEHARLIAEWFNGTPEEE